MRKIFFSGFLLLLLAPSQAQQNSLSLTFQMSLPMGGYKKNYPKTGAGVLCGYLHSFATEPFTVSLGFEAGLLEMSEKDTTFNGIFRNTPGHYVVSASNYIFTLSPKLRIDLFSIGKSGKVFIEESIGANIFFSYAGVSHDVGYDPITDQTSVHYDSSAASSYWVLRAAAGAGIEMGLGKKTSTKLLFKFSYVYGAWSKYYTNPSIDQFQISMVPKESATCMLLAECGFRFRLGGKKDKN